MDYEFNKRAIKVFGERNRNMPIESPNIWTDEREGRLLTYLDLEIVKKWALAGLVREGIKKPSILDVGAGKGRMTRHFAELGGICVALEPFQDFFGILKMVCKPYLNVEIYNCTLSKYVARSSRQFNLIYVSGATPYLDGKELRCFFNDAMRCLEPKGLMCVREYGSAIRTDYTPNDINRTPEHLVGIAHESGFECARWRRAYPPFLIDRLCSAWPNVLTNGLKIMAFRNNFFTLWELLSQLNLPRGRKKCFYVYLFKRLNSPSPK
jgi:SAM-dependent methyltransferase